GRVLGLPDERLHAILGQQLELLQFALPPFLLGREKRPGLKRGELPFVSLVLFTQPPELFVHLREPLDEDLAIRHAPPFAVTETKRPAVLRDCCPCASSTSAPLDALGPPLEAPRVRSLPF